jgi:hypothetical protein
LNTAQAWARLEFEQDPAKARTLMEAAVKAEPFNLKLWQAYEKLEKLISGEGSAQVSSHMIRNMSVNPSEPFRMELQC